MATKKKDKKKETAAATASTASASTTAPNTAPAAGQPGADLSIADLKNLATIIDVASTRGAFRANEMATVGVMFNKLSAFLARVAPTDTPAEQPVVGKDGAEQAPIPTGK
jgi:hypothetical protein